MEFDELKKVWDTQNNKPMYVIQEEGLHRRIRAKQAKSTRIANLSELMLILINAFAGIFMLLLDFPPANVFLVILGIWMLMTSGFLIVSRLVRIRGNRRYDRSLRGDLAHAIAVAAYQVRLSQLMRANNLAIFILVMAAAWKKENALWAMVGVVSCFALAYFVSKKEHGFYKSRKQELEGLRGMMEADLV
jgi:hypothetical protein